jgi:hypothetical protein
VSDWQQLQCESKYVKDSKGSSDWLRISQIQPGSQKVDKQSTTTQENYTTYCNWDEKGKYIESICPTQETYHTENHQGK